MDKVTKEAAVYKKATVAGVNCGTCASMNDDGTCTKVQGIVLPSMTCALWTKATR